MEPSAFGRMIRRQRRRHGLRQAELAALADVGARFVSELENGTPTLEIGRALRVAAIVGLTVHAEPKSWGNFPFPDDG
jgi:HTH-type transcriptional regulator / antitoxin HipB